MKMRFIEKSRIYTERAKPRLEPYIKLLEPGWTIDLSY